MSGDIVLIGGMALITFAIRYSLFGAGQYLSFPPVVARALNFVPVAVLSAIVAPAMFLPDGETWHLALDNAYLAGGVAAILIAAASRHFLATISGGMLCFVLWRFLFG